MKIQTRIPTVKLKIPGQKLKVKNYNLNVTEVRDSDFKNAFSRIFNFTVGILIRDTQSNHHFLDRRSRTTAG